MTLINRSFPIFCLLLTISSFSYCQTSFGIKAGINASKAEFKPFEEESLNYTLRFHAGVFSEIKIYRRIFIKPEVLYTNKGWNTSNYNKGIDMNLHYLNIPFLAGYSINKRVSVLAGPEYGYLLRAGNSKSALENELFQKHDWGISFGAAFNFASRFGFEFRYIHGFKGLIKDKTLTDEFGVPVLYVDKAGSNKAIQISTRYRFKNL